MIPKGAATEVIPDFTVRKGGQNISLMRQIKFSPQLLHLAYQDGVIYGTTGGKKPCVFAQPLDSEERLWEVPIEGDPDGVVIADNRLVMYSRQGTVTEGQTNLYFLGLDGKLQSTAHLPGVPSQVAVAGGYLFVGCRDGKLYAFKGDKLYWSYSVPGGGKDDGGFRPCPYYVDANHERVAFSSFGTVYVLNHQGKLLYTWSMPDHVSTSKTEYVSITISMGGGSVTALALAQAGDRIWVGANDTLYALEKGRIASQKSIGKNARINAIACLDNEQVVVTTFDHCLLVGREKISARFPIGGSGYICASRAANRIAVYNGNNLWLSTAAGTVMAEVEFAKTVHHITILDDARILVGTRYAILLDTSTTVPQKSIVEKPKDQPTIAAAERPTTEQDFPLMWRSARKLSVGSGKAVYQGAVGAERTIEQAVLEQLTDDGYKGVWSENNAWWQILALLFWDVLFARLPGVYSPQLGTFPGPHQDMPNDMFQPEFYQRRVSLIDKRIKQFAQSGLFGLSKPLNPCDELQKAYRSHQGQRCRLIEDWQRFALDDLMGMVSRISSEQLMKIMLHMLEDFNEYRRGLPDLFLSDPGGKPVFVEVKSEKEKVADHQWVWSRYLRDKVDIPVIICRVINSE